MIGLGGVLAGNLDSEAGEDHHLRGHPDSHGREPSDSGDRQIGLRTGRR